MLQGPITPGLPLSDITTLSYETYQAQAGPQAISLQLSIDLNVGDTNSASPAYQGRLVYEPYLDSGNIVTSGTWQTWNPFTSAGWWFSRSATSTFATAASPKTLAAIIAEYPNIRISPLYGGLMELKAGSGWTNFIGYVDDLQFGTASGTTIYNFEPNSSGTQIQGNLEPVTATPTIYTPIYTNQTSISGTAVAGSSVVLTINSTPLTAVTADPSGFWIVNGLTLTSDAGDTVSATALATGDTISAAATTTVTATPSVVLNAPPGFSLTNASTPGEFTLGTNTGHSTGGSVVSTNDTWTLTVQDQNQGTFTGHMVSGASDLSTPIEVDVTSSLSGGSTISNYQNLLSTLTNYGEANGTFTIPLYASQTVMGTDTPGIYGITLAYTIAPGEY
jgi:hypothetical protein